jgi:uridine kinase
MVFQKIRKLKKKKKKNKLDIPEYNLKEGIDSLIDRIKEKMVQDEDNIVIEIAGGSASGKTTAVANVVKKIFGKKALIISIDDYYRGKKFMDDEAKKGKILSWDQPEALDLDLFEKHLLKLKLGESVEKPVYDMKICESIRTEKISPRKIIIIEGLFVINNKLKDEGDIKVFVNASKHGRIMRRLSRDIQRTGEKPASILKYFSQVVEPMHKKYVESTKKNADLIINNEYSPKIESKKRKFHEI